MGIQSCDQLCCACLDVELGRTSHSDQLCCACLNNESSGKQSCDQLCCACLDVELGRSSHSDQLCCACLDNESSGKRSCDQLCCACLDVELGRTSHSHQLCCACLDDESSGKRSTNQQHRGSFVSRWYRVGTSSNAEPQFASGVNTRSTRYRRQLRNTLAGSGGTNSIHRLLSVSSSDRLLSVSGCSFITTRCLKYPKPSVNG